VTTFKVTDHCAHKVFLYIGFPATGNEIALNQRLAAHPPLNYGYYLPSQLGQKLFL